MKYNHRVFRIARGQIASVNVALAFLSLTLFSGCNSLFGMPDQMQDMQDKMGGMKDTMGNMNNDMGNVKKASHDQVLDGAIKDMFDANNTMSLSAPAAMMPAAKIYADEATPEELIEYSFILMTDINQGVPDYSLQNTDGTWPATVIAQYDTHKNVERTVLTLIAGLATQDKVSQVVNDQVDHHGLYEAATYSFLMFRYVGIETVILPEGDLTKLNGADNLATLQDAVTNLESLDYIRGLSYLTQLKFNVQGMLDKTMNHPLGLSASDLRYPKTEYKSLRSFIQKLPPNVLSTTEAQELADVVQKRVLSN